MPKNNKIFNDISKVASSTMATMVNIKNDLATYISHQIKSALKSMDFVSKNDFQALKKSVENMNTDIKTIKTPVNYSTDHNTHLNPVESNRSHPNKATSESHTNSSPIIKKNPIKKALNSNQIANALNLKKVKSVKQNFKKDSDNDKAKVSKKASTTKAVKKTLPVKKVSAIKKSMVKKSAGISKVVTKAKNS